MNLIYLSTFLLFFTYQAHAKPYGLSVGISPFAGTADTTADETVEHNTGLKISVDKTFPIISRFSLGPRLEASNSYTSTKKSKDNRTQLSNYDIRSFGIGFISTYRLSSEQTPKRFLYLSSAFGRNYAKIKQDESGDNFYVEKNFHNIKGYYQDTEFGLKVLVKSTLGFNIGGYYHTNYLDLSGVSATVDGEEINPSGGLSLTGDPEAEKRQLPRNITVHSYGLKIGMNILI